MDARTPPAAHVEDWDVQQVSQWLSYLGFSKYDKSFNENGISGDILVHLDHSSLKDLGVQSVGQRMAMLKAIYELKLAHDIPIEQEHYIPPSAEVERAVDSAGNPDTSKIMSLLQDRDNRVLQLEEQVSRLNTNIEQLRTEFHAALRDRASVSRQSVLDSKPTRPLPEQPDTFKRSPNEKNSAPPSPRSPVVSRRGLEDKPNGPTHKPSSSSIDSLSRKKGGDRASTTGSRSDVTDSFVGFRVTLDDPCYKVLPEALKKYNIDDDWRQYKLFICYGDQERCLEHDEKPLHWFQKLKEEKLNPVFRLRHIRHIKSPGTATTLPTPFTEYASPMRQANGHQPSQSLSVPGVGLTGRGADTSAGFQLHNPDPLSATLPSFSNSQLSNGQKQHAASSSISSTSAVTSNIAYSSTSHDSSSTVAPSQPTTNGPMPPSTPPPEDYVSTTVEASGVAMAIYPYAAERDDELDVVVGDTFNIKSKSDGWWIVERRARAPEIANGFAKDANGEQDAMLGIGQIGWVPAGCLLETEEAWNGATTTVPANVVSPGSSTAPPVSSFVPAQARADYVKAGTDELSVQTGDDLRIYKRYNHWVYAVNVTDNASRGWIPSWYCGFDDDVDPGDVAPLSDVNGGASSKESASRFDEDSAVDPSSPRWEQPNAFETRGIQATAAGA